MAAMAVVMAMLLGEAAPARAALDPGLASRLRRVETSFRNGDAASLRPAFTGNGKGLLVARSPSVVSLVDWKTRPLAEGKRVLRLRTREFGGPIAIVYGWQSETPTAAYELRQDGVPLASGYGGSIEDPIVVDGYIEHKLALEAYGSTADGVLALAYYELKD